MQVICLACVSGFVASWWSPGDPRGEVGRWTATSNWRVSGGSSRFSQGDRCLMVVMGLMTTIVVVVVVVMITTTTMMIANMMMMMTMLATMTMRVLLYHTGLPLESFLTRFIISCAHEIHHPAICSFIISYLFLFLLLLSLLLFYKLFFRLPSTPSLGLRTIFARFYACRDVAVG